MHVEELSDYRELLRLVTGPRPTGRPRARGAGAPIAKRAIGGYF